ncbi:DUF4390 domain-containing protein [Desulfonatronovibrio magnus]|uniref:DUF4390 domain-containing protein n=1 Tax=Desulfonatronovibrio magnus TaxID=698827 RepID=UPI0005EADDB4|nr:DUF4390 domain-containing protein [Desulfonatronovibrio magnus]RQD59747.1 MAG: DUF4390 domain-containing protein [Desulfonatronovibrio sp. MSAO_Bac4]
MKFRYILIFLAIFCFSLLLPQRGSAQSLELSSFVIDTRGEYLTARFSIDVEEFNYMKSYIDSGSKLAIIYDVKLLKKRMFFPDFPLSSQQHEVGLEKDLLSGQYVVLYPDERKTMDSFEEYDFVKIFEGIDVPLAPLIELEPGRKYVVRIQIRLISKGVPKWIKRTLFFWSWDLAKAIRYEMEFSL